MSEELFENVKNGNLDEVRRLLDEEGGDVSVVDNNSNTPLHWACQNGHIQLVCTIICNIVE